MYWLKISWTSLIMIMILTIKWDALKKSCELEKADVSFSTTGNNPALLIRASHFILSLESRLEIQIEEQTLIVLIVFCFAAFPA